MARTAPLRSVEPHEGPLDLWALASERLEAGSEEVVRALLERDGADSGQALAVANGLALSGSDRMLAWLLRRKAAAPFAPGPEQLAEAREWGRLAPGEPLALLDAHRDGEGEVEDPQALIRAVCAHPAALAKVVRIDTPRGSEPFDLWPIQHRALQLALDHRELIALKARQLGFTWTLCCLLGLWDAIAHPSGDDLVVSLNERVAVAVIARARRLYVSAPSWLRDAFPLAVDRSDAIGVAHGQGTSLLLSLPASSDSGRSFTFRRIMADERARWERSDERMASLAPTIADGGSLVELSTAKGFNDFRSRYLGAVEAGQDPALGNGAVRIFAGARERPGRDDAWVQRERARLGALGPQEYPLSAAEAFVASGRCVLDASALQGLLDGFCAPPALRADLRATPAGVIAEPHAGGAWQIWRWPERGRSYLIGADPCGGGSGRDAAYASVHDVDSWDQVACLWGRPEPERLAELLILAGALYAGPAGPALLAPEANNHGAAVIAVLRERRYPRIYRHRRFDTRARQAQSQLGWQTTAATRPVAIAALQESVADGSLGVRDAAAVGEMLTFIENERGRYEAEEGYHDDRVMALAIVAAILSRRPSAPAGRHAPAYQPRVSALTGY